MWGNILLIVVLIICVVTDIKSRRIYNKIIFPALIFGLLIQFFSGGALGVLHGIEAFLVGLAILLIPYLLGGMGAGDVKLLAVIGAIKGLSFVLMTAIYMGVVGGIIAIAVILFKDGVVNKIKSVYYFIASLLNGVRVPLLINHNMTATYPYGVAIAFGALISLLTRGGFLL